ncbi:MAG: hypothetical protein JO356_13420, partial [Acidobacteria bacterium]|nr:hypothetical protein [Acidobacteriota bacterium]
MNYQKRIRHVRYWAALCAGGVLLILGGCSKKEAESNRVSAPGTAGSKMPAGNGLRKTWGLRVKDRPGTVFHVEYSDKTNVVDMQTVARTFRGVSEDHSIFIFEDSPELRQKLVPGKFVLFEGLDLRKVDALAVDGKKLVVGTETAPLKEALKNANVQWNVPVDWDELFGQLGARRDVKPESNPWALGRLPDTLWDMIQPTAYATFTNTEMEGEVEIADTDFNTWKCHYHFTRQPGFSSSKYFPKPSLTGAGVDIDVQLDREGKGMSVGIHMKGHLTKFEQISSILMADGSIQHAYYKNVGMHGNMDLDWEISTTENQTSMHEVRFKLPGKITIPLMEFDLPMSIQ